MKKKPRGPGRAEVSGDERAPHQTHAPPKEHQESMHQQEVCEDGDTLPRGRLVRRCRVTGQQPNVVL